MEIKEIEARYHKAIHPEGHPSMDCDLHEQADRKAIKTIPVLLKKVKFLAGKLKEHCRNTEHCDITCPFEDIYNCNKITAEDWLNVIHRV